MSLDVPTGTRWVTLVVGHYPDGSTGWDMRIWTSEASIDEVLGPPMARPRPGYQPRPPMASYQLDDMINMAIKLYHDRVGPAYSMDDLDLWFYPFANVLDMFDAIGARLLATDGIVPDFHRPQVSTAPHP